MTVYLDTSVIVAAVDERDPNHERGLSLLSKLPGARRVVSRLTLVELASVFSRAGLEEPAALALYAVRRVGAEVVEVDFNEVLAMAFRYAHVLKLRTLDLLHLAACSLCGAAAFATLDGGIASRSKAVKEALGVEVIFA